MLTIQINSRAINAHLLNTECLSQQLQAIFNYTTAFSYSAECVNCWIHDGNADRTPFAGKQKLGTSFDVIRALIRQTTGHHDNAATSFQHIYVTGNSQRRQTFTSTTLC